MDSAVVCKGYELPSTEFTLSSSASLTVNSAEGLRAGLRPMKGAGGDTEEGLLPAPKRITSFLALRVGTRGGRGKG